MVLEPGNSGIGVPAWSSDDSLLGCRLLIVFSESGGGEGAPLGLFCEGGHVRHEGSAIML